MSDYRSYCVVYACDNQSITSEGLCATHYDRTIIPQEVNNDATKIEAGGLKYDDGKPDFTYLSLELLEEVAKVRAFGAKKYARNNWKKGFKILRSCAAALRHTFAFINGQDNDPESGHSHLAHAICCLEHALYDMKHHPENDDRDK